MDETVLDPRALRRLMEVIGGEPDDLRDLVEDFVESAPDLVESMRAAVESGDGATLRRGAHTLKGNARDFGATRLAERCEALERACRDGAPPDAARDVAAIAEEEAAAREALRSLDVTTLGA